MSHLSEAKCGTSRFLVGGDGGGADKQNKNNKGKKRQLNLNLHPRRRSISTRGEDVHVSGTGVIRYFVYAMLCVLIFNKINMELSSSLSATG